ncbi:signal peptidase I [Sphaerisporangium sp. NBC_01403]|uniref:signal peptidase I n=1 Tax=Sphaerisporangium sp. NBC_01403 TaxID=2903599 RepID=UPI003244707B
MTAVAVLAAGCFLAAGVALWLRRGFVVVTVAGGSMEPTFRTGDRVLVRRARLHRIQAGDVVVMRPPDRSAAAVPAGTVIPHLIKRAVALPGDPVPRDRVPALRGVAESAVPPGRLVLLGDNPAGADSRQFGYFPEHRLLGVVVRRLMATGAGL